MEDPECIWIKDTNVELSNTEILFIKHTCTHIGRYISCMHVFTDKYVKLLTNNCSCVGPVMV